MKASDAKQFIGQFVSYQRGGWPFPRYGTVMETIGRNIIMDNDTLWAPDISDMRVVPITGPVSEV